MMLKVKLNSGKEKYTFFRLHNYTNGNLAVQIMMMEDGVPEPWDMLTVNLMDGLQKDQAFLNTNNIGCNVFDVLEQEGLIEPTGIVHRSGYCSYPLYRFHSSFLDCSCGFVL